MKRIILVAATVLVSSSYAFAADVNFDVNVRSRSGNTDTGIRVGNTPPPPPAPVVVREQTVIIKEQGARHEEVRHDNGKKKGHYKEKHKKHKKHDRHDD